MLFTYVPRVFRFAFRGKRAHTRALRSSAITERAALLTPKAGLSALEIALYEDCYSKPMLVKTYCGFRMMDLFGHVNNAKYLEMMECARWYYLAYTNLEATMRKRGVFFVVSNVSLQFVREIKPYQNVYVTCLAIPTRGPTPGSIDRQRMSILQEVYSADGKKLYASAVMHAALMGSREYAAELATKYPSQDSEASDGAASAGHKNVVLDVYKALSDAMGSTSDQLLIDWVVASEKSITAARTASDTGVTWLNDLNKANRDYRASVRSKTIDVHDTRA